MDAAKTVSPGDQLSVHFAADTITLFDRNSGAAIRSTLNEGLFAHG